VGGFANVASICGRPEGKSDWRSSCLPLKQVAHRKQYHWDSVEADGTYDAEHIAIVHGQLRRGAAQIAVDGTLVAAAPTLTIVPGKTRDTCAAIARGDEMPAFDAVSVLHAHVRATKVATSDLMPLAGLDLR